MLITALRRLPLFVAIVAPCACGDLTGLGDVFGGRLISVEVSAGQGTVVEVGDTIRLTASGRVDGIAGIFGYSRILDAIWTTSDATIARIELLPPPPPT